MLDLLPKILWITKTSLVHLTPEKSLGPCQTDCKGYLQKEREKKNPVGDSRLKVLLYLYIILYLFLDYSFQVGTLTYCIFSSDRLNSIFIQKVPSLHHQHNTEYETSYILSRSFYLFKSDSYQIVQHWGRAFPLGVKAIFPELLSNIMTTHKIRKILFFTMYVLVIAASNIIYIFSSIDGLTGDLQQGFNVSLHLSGFHVSHHRQNNQDWIRRTFISKCAHWNNIRGRKKKKSTVG